MGAPITGVFVPSAARTTNGSQELSPGIGDYDRVAIYVPVTTVAGTTPTLDLVLEDSPDNGATWFTVATATQVTAVGQAVIRLGTNTAFAGRLRLRWTIGGTTPSFTFAAHFAAQRDGA